MTRQTCWKIYLTAETIVGSKKQHIVEASMNQIKRFYGSSIGKKFVVAVTGIALFGFIAGHMAGNLKVFTGATPSGVPHIDEYALFLKTLGAPFLPKMMGLWIARSVLVVCLILHVVTVILLSRQNKKARPIAYVRSKKQAVSLASRLMMASGLVILAFIPFHILQFTTGNIRIGDPDFAHGNVYSNLYGGFSVWYVTLGYAVVVTLLGFHLFHGLWSLFQTLGLDNPDRNGKIRAFSVAFSVIITLGFILVPLAFFSGWMPSPTDYDPSLLNPSDSTTNH